MTLSTESSLPHRTDHRDSNSPSISLMIMTDCSSWNAWDRPAHGSKAAIAFVTGLSEPWITICVSDPEATLDANPPPPSLDIEEQFSRGLKKYLIILPETTCTPEGTMRGASPSLAQCRRRNCQITAERNRPSASSARPCFRTGRALD